MSKNVKLKFSNFYYVGANKSIFSHSWARDKYLIIILSYLRIDVIASSYIVKDVVLISLPVV